MEQHPIKINKVQIRNLQIEDYVQLSQSFTRVYSDGSDVFWTREQIQKLIKIFPEGQIVTVVDDKIVGCALSIIVDYDKVKNDHTYAQVTGKETFNTHSSKGNILYGIEVFIHPGYRGLRLARRMYEYRKELCETLNLKAIMFGGRIPNYHKYADKMRPKEYIERVRQREIYDPVHGYYYPSCKGKCEPILQHMLQGLEVDENPLLNPVHEEEELEIVFEDEWLLVVNKPAGMLSVPGKAEDRDSVYHRLKKKYPEATGPMIVHRLDMATSGLLLVAKTKEVHQDLQAQFANRSIKKRYMAVLDGAIIKTEKETKPIAEKAILIAKETVSTKKTAKAERTGNTGRIELPLCLNPLDRPRQMVSSEHGKEAITEYQIISESERITSESENTFNESNRIDESERSINESRKYTRIIFYPLTGRTHQLRVHAAHPEGLGCPILGDELYGKKADRLYLHAEYIEFRHPIYGDILCIQKEADFHKNMIKP